MELNIYRIERIYKIKRISFPRKTSSNRNSYVIQLRTIYVALPSHIQLSLPYKSRDLSPLNKKINSNLSFTRSPRSRSKRPTLNRLISPALIYRCSDISNISTLEARIEINSLDREKSMGWLPKGISKNSHLKWVPVKVTLINVVPEQSSRVRERNSVTPRLFDSIYS